MINFKNFKKKGQTEVIITVLLILIGIAAVGFVGVFLTSMVRDNLKQTDCFKTTGQISLNLGYTFFNITNKTVFVSISRGSADFNLTGLIITFGTQQSSKGVTIRSGDKGNLTTGSAMLDNSGKVVDGIMVMPGLSETISYGINSSTYTVINIVSVTPILKDGKICENTADEKEIKTVV